MSFVGPSEDWDDYGYDAKTEISVAAPARRGGVEAQSRWAPGSRQTGSMGGYSEHELAALPSDDWEAPPQRSTAPSYQAGRGAGYIPRGTHGGAPPPAAAAGHQPVQAGAAGEVLCPTCGGVALQRTSNTAKNPNRTFYKCPNEACRFFKWADELSAGASGSLGGSDGAGASPGPASKRRITEYGGSQGHQPGYGFGGATAPPAIPGTNNLQGAVDGGALRDRSNDTCFKCNQVGHWSSNCPNQPGPGAGGDGMSGGMGGGGGGGARGGECFKCGQPGHWASKCPNQGPGGGAGGGNYGGLSGGGYAGSRYRAEGAGGGGVGGWSASQGEQGGGGGARGSCFKCGETGHWSRDCPNQGGGGGRGGGGGGYTGGGSYGGGAGGGNKRKYGGGAGYGGGSARGDGGGCFKCGGDHYSNACPNR